MIEVSSTIRTYKGWIDYNTFLENKGKTTVTSLLQTFNIVYVNFTSFYRFFVHLYDFHTFQGLIDGLPPVYY